MGFRACVSLLSSLSLVAVASAQSTGAAWGQCGGIGWTGATLCPSGYACTETNEYYSQCIPGTATTTVATSGSGTTAVATSTGTSASSGPAPTLVGGYSFIRAVEDPEFHQYLRSEVPDTVSDAVLGDPDDAAQFIVTTDGQLTQLITGSSDPLYAIVEERANSSVVKLKMSWSATPATSGTFVFTGDTLEWSTPNFTRPQDNAWLVCPDDAGNKLVYINLGFYDYETPTGCSDETIHAYTGSTPTA